MAITLIDDVGSALSNTYIDLPDAELYFESRINSEVWDNITDDEQKKKALVSAARQIDYETFEGQRTNTTQALKFPRRYLPLQDGVSIDNIIPTQVKQAQCELAIHLLSVDMSKLETTNAPIEKVRVGGVELNYKLDKNDNLTVPATQLPPFVVSLLAPFAKTITSGGIMTVGR